MRILLVEDDPMIAESAAESLREEGHDVQRVSDGRNAMAQLKVHGYDFVLLDLGLPGADGMTVLRTLRAAKNTTPVIILTARDALDDRLAGLDAGADDYVVKPFHMSEILARMRAVQRRRFGFEADGNLTNGAVTLIDAEKAKSWLAKGVQPTETVKALLVHEGVIEKSDKLSAPRTKTRKKK